MSFSAFTKSLQKYNQLNNSPAKVIVLGLGNAERDRIKNRHNAGHLLLQELILSYGHGAMQSGHYYTCTPVRGCENVILAKNTTLMNLSSDAVAELFQRYKSLNTELIVVHDDMDLKFGQIKFYNKKYSKHHRGLQSISKNTDKTYARIGIGIGRPKSGDVPSFVLDNFTVREQSALQSEICDKLCDYMEDLLDAFDVKGKPSK